MTGLFTKDLNIQKVSISFLRHLTLIYPLVSIAITSGRVLQGLGKGIPVLVITTVRVLGLSAPLAIYFSIYLNKSDTDVEFDILLIASAISAEIGKTSIFLTFFVFERLSIA